MVSRIRFLVDIAAELAQDGDKNCENDICPSTEWNPNVIAAPFKLNPIVSVSFDPDESFAQDTGVHVVPYGALKEEQQ